MENLLFYHSPRVEGQPRYTSAARITNDGIEVGYSRCSVRDQFCRAIGRKISSGRLEVGKSVFFPVPGINDATGKERVQEFIAASQKLFSNIESMRKK